MNALFTDSLDSFLFSDIRSKDDVELARTIGPFGRLGSANVILLFLKGDVCL